MRGYSKSGKYLIVGVNEDSKFAARVLDATDAEPVTLPGMPTGLVQGVGVAPNDSLIAFYASDGSVPPELYVAAIGAAPRRLTNALDPKMKREDLVVPTVVRFKSYDSLEVPGVLYKPHQASSEAKAPAMVLVHGGPGGQAQVGYFAAHAGAREPRLRRVRHQQPRLERLRQDVLPDGRPQARRGRPRRRRRRASGCSPASATSTRRRSASSAAAMAAT